MNERSIFLEALEITAPAERAAFLDRACNGDADLRKGVERLLAANERSGSFMRRPAAGDATSDFRSSEGPGSRVGAYKLLQEIGEGGMGTVFMAEQEEPVRRMVALKIIRDGMDSKGVLARFEAERQALALMDHPNIARVLDAGATPHGSPYFVMELVKGVPITKFCDAHQLSLRERLELFVPVCQAIQHAHMKGIIHRDVKPSNVLVALYDDKPVPKVIDFGVAKATSQRLTDKTLFTAFGAVVGTLEYMSPEQAKLNQLDIDTRSDVYALGVLLYELLTGSTPLDRARLKSAALDEVLRLIREEEPPRPSTRLSTAATLAQLAAARGSPANQLGKAIRGELDWIVMRCLEKDRARRYESAIGLARDVEHYLKDEPVEACPPTLGYRLRKYARKNKVILATTTAVAAALVVGIALASWQAVRATNAERDTAAEQAKTAAALDDALTLGRRLDERLGDLKAANDKNHRDQETMRANQYAWDMQTLPITWEAGNVAEARRLLERQDPALRHFEWHFWNRQANAEIASTALKVPPEDTSMRGARGARTWAFSGDGGRVALIQLPFGLLSRTPASGWSIVVKVWDAESGRERRSYSIPLDRARTGSMSGGRGRFPDLSTTRLSHDGKRLLVFDENPRSFGETVDDRSALVLVLDVDSGKELFDSRKVSGLWAARVVTLSPNGRKLYVQVSADRSKPTAPQSIKAWDLDDGGKELFTIENAYLHQCSPKGTRLIGIRANDAAEGNKRPPTVWDATTGELITSWERGRILGYTPDESLLVGSTLVGEGAEGKLVLKRIDSVTGKELPHVPLPSTTRVPSSEQPEGFQTAHLTAVFSPDGSRLALYPDMMFGFGGTTTTRVEWLVYDLHTWRHLFTLDDPTSSSPTGRGPAPNTANVRFRSDNAPFFTADGKQFVCCNDNVILTFDASTGKPLHTLRGHVNPVADCAATPDGRLRSVEGDGTLKAWDRTPAAPVSILPNSESFGFTRGGRIALSADGAWVAVAVAGEGGDVVELWDAVGKNVKEFKPVPQPREVGGSVAMWVALSGDGKRVALVRAPRPTASLFPGAKPQPVKPAEPQIGDLTVWDVASGRQAFRTVLPAARILFANQFGFARDGRSVAIVTRDGADVPLHVQVLDGDTGALRRSIPLGGEATSVSGLWSSPDGKRLAAITRSRSPEGTTVYHLTGWDVATGARLYAVDLGRNSSQEGLGWSSDGSRLAVAGIGGEPQITVYDAATGDQKVSLNLSDRGSAPASGAAPAFSPDGRRIACAVRDRTGTIVVKVWDADGGTELLALQPALLTTFSSGEATPLVFSADGHRLIRVTEGARVGGSPNPKGGRPQGAITIQTWDATPRPDPKK